MLAGLENIQHESYGLEKEEDIAGHSWKEGESRSGRALYFEPGSLDLILKSGRDIEAFEAGE